MNRLFYVICFVIINAVLLAGCGAPANTNTANSPAKANQNTNQAPAAEKAAHWDYEANGPAKWAGLNKDWAICGEGKSQSPIDIVAGEVSTLPKLAGKYEPAELRVIHNEHKSDGINNGHTIQINYSNGDTFTVDGTEYELKQFHFHSPSEHTVGGKHSPMEMHFVHQSADKKLAVVGVFIEEGKKPNAAFEPIWANLPSTKGAESHFPDIKIDVDQLLPAKQSTYRYDGSLTTPPCSESVKWFVMSTPIELSAEQIAKFRAIIKGNNRPTQSLNGRKVASDHVEEKAG